jgi:aryl-alcohol dehydrogenase-like predicted oxidoreductase
MSTFALGQIEVRRSGYGAMQLAGSFAFGEPPDHATAIGVLRAAVDAGVNHIDTAQYYGPGIVNDLIREALHPYPDGLAVVSKVAVRRDATGAVLPFDDPDQLREGIETTFARCESINWRRSTSACPATGASTLVSTSSWRLW